jgi:hypothetical protein
MEDDFDGGSRVDPEELDCTFTFDAATVSTLVRGYKRWEISNGSTQFN